MFKKIVKRVCASACGVALFLPGCYSTPETDVAAGAAAQPDHGAVMELAAIVRESDEA